MIVCFTISWQNLTKNLKHTLISEEQILHLLVGIFSLSVIKIFVWVLKELQEEQLPWIVLYSFESGVIHSLTTRSRNFLK